MFDFVKDLNSLRPYVAREDKWRFILLLVLMLVGACFEAVGLGAVPAFLALITTPTKLETLPLIGNWFHGMPEQATFSLVMGGALVLLGIYLFKSIFLIAVYFFQSILVENQRIKLSSQVFDAYQNAPYEWHLKRSSAELMRNINGDTRVIIDQILLPFLNLIMAGVMTLVVVVVLLVATPGVAFLSIALVGGGIFLSVGGFKKHLLGLGQIAMQERKNSTQAVLQGLGAVMDARILHCQEYLSEVFRSSVTRMAKARQYEKTMSRASPYILEIMAILGLLSVMIIFFIQDGNLQSKFPLLSLFAISTVRLKQTMNSIASALNAMNYARASIPHIVADLEAIQKIEKKREQVKTGVSIGTFQQLKLDEITYQYPESDTPAIREVSLELKHGESIAFVGTTGCGKSTLANIILGFLNPQQGRVLVNGVDIQQDLEGWYANVGYIPQSIFLIDDTIRANVAFGLTDSEISEDQVWSSLHSACLDEFIQTLPEGIDTIVGERGVRLSGGQRQRLGIARALYRNPQVIIMDEATSALDNQTEESVMQAISHLREDHALIMIAHRLSTVEECDRRYTLDAGRIISVTHATD